MVLYLSLSFLFLVVNTVLGTPTFYDLNDAKQLFADFIEKYERHYESAEEYNRRFEIFKTKLLMINRWNKIHEPTFSVNQFADKDLSENRTGFVPSKQMRAEADNILLSRYYDFPPESLDYREMNLVTEVKAQGECMSCYIFAAVGNIEGQYAKLTGELISLSEQQALDCVGNPCDRGGDPLNVIRSLSLGDGLEAKEDYLRHHYEGGNGDHYCDHKHRHCYTNKQNIKVKVTSGSSIYTPDEETLKTALLTYGPLAIAIRASKSVELYDGRAVLKPFDCYDGEDTDHNVLLVGYSEDEHGTPYWIIKNSWGKNWGRQGYLHLEMGKGHCSILKEGAVTAGVMPAYA